MKSTFWSVIILASLAIAAGAAAENARIEVHADHVLGRVSPFLTGACLEDVNHEVYGGIDSQMIFGESFAEPVPPPPLQGFSVFGGRWTPVADGSLAARGSGGAKIAWDGPIFSNGEVSVDVRLSETGGGNAGLILKVSDAGTGADAFNGYEVSLEPPGTLVIGRHRHNWEPLRRVACAVPVEQWIKLSVRTTETTLDVWVNDAHVARYEDREHPLPAGAAGLRTWENDVRFRDLTVTTGGMQQRVPFASVPSNTFVTGVSGMWRAVQDGTATGSFALDTVSPFSGKHSQQITFAAGTGALGIENQGLNRCGMNFVKDKPYEGYLFVRSRMPTEFFVALESRDGTRAYAEQKLKTAGNSWHRVDFTLKPRGTDRAGRFTIKMKHPGTMAVGYALLQPGEWGRFKGLPVRKDVALGLIDQGVTVLRFGGCMANAAGYRWKNMTGPRALRPPYPGWWYPYASNGWGIFDFLNFCEAAGFLAVPDVNGNETPADLADFIEYVNGPADSPWGRRRAADGHPRPYGLKYLEIGNEERVDESYWRKFKAIAEAVWARDPKLILVVGDFAYGKPIADPFHFTGAAGGITSLAAHQKILQLAKAQDREVWFDVHVNTEGPQPDFGGTFSYIDALDKIADGAKHRVVIFEFNAGNHAQRRALANAAALIQVERDGRLPIATSANCLQPDRQNDNNWDQGLLFLNPAEVWLQPPGYVTQMAARHYEPRSVEAVVHGADGQFVAGATCSEDGRALVLKVVNTGEHAQPVTIQLGGFMPRNTTARVTELAAPLHATNTADAPERVKPHAFDWRHPAGEQGSIFELAPRSFTVIRFE